MMLYDAPTLAQQLDLPSWDGTAEPVITEAQVQEALRLWRQGRVDLAQLAGMTADEMEGLYARALELLRNGLVDDATSALSALTLLRPTEPRFYRALAIACQRKRRYGLAYAVYGVALRLAPDDGIALALRAECCVFVEGAEAARTQLQRVVARGARTPAEIPYVERARLLLKGMGK